MTTRRITYLVNMDTASAKASARKLAKSMEAEFQRISFKPTAKQQKDLQSAFDKVKVGGSAGGPSVAGPGGYRGPFPVGRGLGTGLGSGIGAGAGAAAGAQVARMRGVYEAEMMEGINGLENYANYSSERIATRMKTKFGEALKAVGIGAGAARFLGPAAAVGAGAMAVKTLAQWSELAEQFTVTENAYSVMTSRMGIDSGVLLTNLTSLSKGTISDQELMLSSMKALRLGAASNAGELENLLAIAADSAQDMGITTEQAFSDLTTGIGRLSPMILDNLGFTVSLEEAYASYAATLGITSGELTKAQQQQAVLADITEKAGDLTAAAVDPSKDLGNAYKQLKIEAGGAFAKLTGYPRLLTGIAGAARNLTGALDGMNTSLAAITDPRGSGDLATTFVNAWTKQIPDPNLLERLSLDVQARNLGFASWQDAQNKSRRSVTELLGGGGALSPVPEGDSSWMPSGRQIAAHERGMAGISTLPRDAYVPIEDLGDAAADAVEKTEELGYAFDNLSGIIAGIPGYSGAPTEVTQGQLDLAAAGIGQNFPDDYLRRLRDEVRHGVDWAGVDIGDAAGAVNLPPSLDPELILAEFERAWADKSLFADEENIEKFINYGAVSAYLRRQAKSAEGAENLQAMLGMGTPEAEERLKAAGIEMYNIAESGLLYQIEDSAGMVGVTFAENLYEGFQRGVLGLDFSGALFSGVMDQVKSEIYEDMAETEGPSG